MNQKHKTCYGLCGRCAWKNNGGCSEWIVLITVHFE